ncbi:hypothetical protein HOA91_05425 [Candidatus Woesearchaeota archaeon]|jgi:hypothetical protein|nr:hypothetical protein [Candidatus Woesearchaeota archaeon]
MEIINSSRKDEILERIQEVRESKRFNTDGSLREIIRNLERTKALKRVRGGHEINYSNWQDYDAGENRLLGWASFHDRGAARREVAAYNRLVRGGRTKREKFFELWTEIFASFSPTVVCYTGGTNLAEDLSYHLSHELNEKVRNVYFHGEVWRDDDFWPLLPNLTKEGNIPFKEFVDVKKGDRAIIYDSLMDPFTIGGIAELLQEKGAKVLGVAGMFATTQFDPEYALPMAKINLKGSPKGVGKWKFYCPEIYDNAKNEKDLRLRKK